MTEQATMRIWLQRKALRWVAVLVLLFAAACDDGAGKKQAKTKEQGQPVLELPLTTLSGESVPFSDLFFGKVVVINFWATWCAPCRKELPSLEALSRRLGPDHFAVVGIAVDNNEALISEYLLDRDVTFRNFIDKQPYALKTALKIEELPTTLLVGLDGTVHRRIVGQTDWSKAPHESWVRRLLEEQ